MLWRVEIYDPLTFISISRPLSSTVVLFSQEAQLNFLSDIALAQSLTTQKSSSSASPLPRHPLVSGALSGGRGELF